MLKSKWLYTSQKRLVTSLKKGIQVKFFTLDQDVGISLKCILTKFKISMPFCFQDIVVQNWMFSTYCSVAILSVV